MIGLDTNVLVRYLVQDDAAQARAAERAIDTATASGEILYVDHIVLCELVWVLSRAYEYDKAEIVVVLEQLLLTRQFEFEGKSLVWTALERYRHGSADFSDYLITAKNIEAGCAFTLSFDRAAAQGEGYRLLK